MPNPLYYVVNGPVGINLDQKDTTAKFPLGFTVEDQKGKEWMYVRANTSAISTSTVSGRVRVFADGTANNWVSANFVANTAFAASEYGWVYLNSSKVVT